MASLLFSFDGAGESLDGPSPGRDGGPHEWLLILGTSQIEETVWFNTRRGGTRVPGCAGGSPCCALLNARFSFRDFFCDFDFHFFGSLTENL